MKYFSSIIFILITTSSQLSQETVTGSEELLKRLNSFSEEYLNKNITLKAFGFGVRLKKYQKATIIAYICTNPKMSSTQLAQMTQILIAL